MRTDVRRSWVLFIGVLFWLLGGCSDDCDEYPTCPESRDSQVTISHRGGEVSFQGYTVTFPESTYVDSATVILVELSAPVPVPEGTVSYGHQIHISTSDSLRRAVTLKAASLENGTFVRYNERHETWDLIRTTGNTAVTDHFSIWDFVFGRPDDLNSPCGDPEVNQHVETLLELVANYADFRCNQWFNSKELLRNYIVEGETPFEIWLTAARPFMVSVVDGFTSLYGFASGIDWASYSLLHAIEVGISTANEYIGIAEDIQNALQNITDQTDLLEFQMMSAQGRMADALANRSGSITRLLQVIIEEQAAYGESSPVDTSLVIQLLEEEKALLEEIIQDSHLRERRYGLDHFYPQQFDVDLSTSIREQAAADTVYLADLIAQLRDDDTFNCLPESWCSELSSHAFNNMHAGAFGEMFETKGHIPFLLCGFQLKIGHGSGNIGSVDGSCRAVVYRVNGDDSVEELAAVLQNGAGGTTDFFFDSPVAIGSEERYAVVLETDDSQWGLWQSCNAGENCCANARPVRIEGGQAIYNDPSYDDYYFVLWTR